MPPRHARTILATIALLALSAPGAHAAQAPGRVVLPPVFGAPESNVDASGGGPAVGLPDGGVLLAAGRRGTVVLTRLRRDGAPEPGFGRDGTARLRVPGDAFSLGQLLRRPDGRLLLVGTTPPATKYEMSRLAVVGLTSQGALDPGFGQGGVARPAANTAGGSGAAALQRDGSLVLTGAIGRVSPEVETNPNAVGNFRWMVARLTPAGAPDTGFGDGGVAAVPVPGGPDTGGFAVGVTDTGRVLALGRSVRRTLLVALTPTGAPDPAYGGGSPVPVPADSAFGMLVDSTGRVDVVSTDRVLRLNPAGAPDATFGEGGTATYPALPGNFSPQVLPTADGGLLVASVTGFDPRPAAEPALRLLRISPGGARGATKEVNPGFGGGLGSFARFRAGLEQDGFLPGTLLRRADGSFLLTGGVKIARYTGEGTGFSTGLPAVAALTPALDPDRAFGGPQTPARFGLAVPAQRASSAAELRRILVRVTASGPGLALLRVRDGRRRVLAQSLEPIYAAGRTTVRVGLTRTGRDVLRRGRSVRVTVGHAFRDVLTDTENGARIARLR
jgi:uncharacterized delta-60 repeat protein